SSSILLFLYVPNASFFSFFFSSYRDHRDLHSFPTRRSSDLVAVIRANVRSASSGSLPLTVIAATARAPSSQRPPDHRHSSERWKDRKSTRLNSSHVKISYAVFCLKKKKKKKLPLNKTDPTTS